MCSTIQMGEKNTLQVFRAKSVAFVKIGTITYLTHVYQHMNVISTNTL